MRSLVLVGSLSLLLNAAGVADDAERLAAEDAASKERQALITQLTEAVEKSPQDVRLRSQRGDACFFEGRFAEAFEDYDQMSLLDPQIKPLNWRRGLALHYLGRYDEAAEQFGLYYELDQSDRENGIWRYYAHVLGHDEEHARAQLLKYEAGDRAPLPEVYRLCAGELEPQAIVDLIAQDDLQGAERDQRLFYGHLYLGMHYVVHDQPDEAHTHLEQALASTWAENGSYGPNYMWHVARLQLAQLDEKQPAE